MLKQDGCWWVETDTSVHCYCGTWLQVSCELAEKPQVMTCPKCGEKWYVGLVVLP